MGDMKKLFIGIFLIVFAVVVAVFVGTAGMRGCTDALVDAAERFDEE